MLPLQTDKDIGQHSGENDEHRDCDDADGNGRPWCIVEFDGKEDEVNDPDRNDANEYPDEEDTAELCEENDSVFQGIRFAVHRRMRALRNESL